MELFSSLVLSAVGRECRKFYNRLSELTADKQKQPYSKIKTWTMHKITILQVNSVDMYLRERRSILSSHGFNDNLESSIQENEMISEHLIIIRI